MNIIENNEYRDRKINKDCTLLIKTRKVKQIKRAKASVIKSALLQLHMNLKTERWDRLTD